MRVVLIHPPARSEYDKHWARFPVLGLAYIAASLRASGHEVVLLDGKLAHLASEEICSQAASAKPDLVGITAMTVEFPQAAAIAHELKSLTPVPIAIGGAHINAVGAEALRECSAFDFACVGEGEHLVNELADAIAGKRPCATIAGLSYRDNGGVRTNPARPYPASYDDLPFPAWDLFRLGEQIPVLTHRGCPYQCNFCSHNSGFKARYRSPDNVLDEIGTVIEQFKPAIIRFEDETFGLHVKRTKAILDGILSRGFHTRVRFSAQTRVDRIDEDFIALLKRANFETLELGVESGNPDVLKAVKKGITLEQVERAVALAKKQRLRVWCKFILGHPHETVATMRDTARFISKLNPQRLSVALMTPFPGTPIHGMAVRGEGGYRMIGRGWQQFDKYSSGALELDTASLGTLKLYQIWCYARLYLSNFRILELLRLVIEHRALALEMIRATGARLASELLHAFRQKQST